MARLKIGIQRVGNIVFGKVLEQDEGLRGDSKLVSGGKVCKEISSEMAPELFHDVLYILGDKTDEDNVWFAYAYKEETIAIQVIRDIRMLVAKVNGRAPSTEEHCGLEVIE